METVQQANWLKEAVNFFVDLYPIKRQRDLNAIYREVTLLLQKYAHAQAAAIIRLEDSITARVLYASDNYISGFINATVIDEVVSIYEIRIANGALITKAPDDILVLIPVKEKAFTGVFALFIDKGTDVNDAFRQFLQHVWTGLKETAMLIQTYYSIEELSTRFNAILGTIPESIVFIDDSGRQGWLNGPAARLLHLNEDNNAPMAIAAAMQQLRNDAVNREDILKEAGQLFSSPNRSIKNWEWLFGTPVELALSVSCVPVRSTNISGRLWVFDDITEIYKANDMLKELNTELVEKRRIADEQNKAKSDFLANMSHEIRTPMNGVIGMASILANTQLTEEQADYVETIRISGETLLSIINDILDFSKIESGKMELEAQPLNIRTAIEETYDLLAMKAGEKGIDLLYYIDPMVPAEIHGDMVRLKQILMNLVSNGLKFTERGEVLVNVTSISNEQDDHILQFSVKDTGIGIPQDKFYKLFDTFSQVDSSTTRKFGGTGLGLAICRRLVALMGGTIKAESTVGVGSTFTFTISAKASRMAINYTARDKTNEQKLTGKRVLVLDDNITNLKIMQAQCELWHMLPLTTYSFDEAEAALRSTPFDLVMVDMLMPGKDGVEVARILKREYPQLPIILFSSAGYLPLDAAEMKELFAVVLHKPAKQAQIERAFIEALNMRSPVARTGAEPIPTSPTRTQNDTAQVKILVAEDNDINQKMIMRALEKLGYTADLAENGKIAVELLHSTRYQLIFMDVMMPEMDGYQATRIIRDMYGDRSDRPVIIATTANALTGDREKIFENGMDDYIPKPFKMQDIKNKIDEWTPKLPQLQ
ncbi:hypothetical protein GCM10023093_02430 [Nemorincola caseinilytica]|uniref:histidine kinase n=1 Tax=Nemorincola caseinilytica TaxID=2054315 RepID=A0ABP8N612_9BACT